MIPKVKKRAPGERLIKRMTLRTKWLLCAVAGILLFGFGLSVVTAAGYKKGVGDAFYIWFLMGTYGLIITALGLVSLGQAIRFRVLMDINKKFHKQEKDLAKQLKRLNRLTEVMKTKEDKKEEKKDEKKAKLNERRPQPVKKENLATTDEV